MVLLRGRDVNTFFALCILSEAQILSTQAESHGGEAYAMRSDALLLYERTDEFHSSDSGCFLGGEWGHRDPWRAGGMVVVLVKTKDKFL